MGSAASACPGLSRPLHEELCSAGPGRTGRAERRLNEGPRGSTKCHHCWRQKPALGSQRAQWPSITAGKGRGQDFLGKQCNSPNWSPAAMTLCWTATSAQARPTGGNQAVTLVCGAGLPSTLDKCARGCFPGSGGCISCPRVAPRGSLNLTGQRLTMGGDQ